jgi:hypothetical protein
MWPLFAGFVRLIIAVGGGWLVLIATGSMTLVFAMRGTALAPYGATVGIAIWSGVWFRNGAATAKYAALSAQAPTVAIRKLLVAPGVPNGTPATMMMRSPSPAKPSI